MAKAKRSYGSGDIISTCKIEKNETTIEQPGYRNLWKTITDKNPTAIAI
jgi:hypothetical protein